MPRLELSRRARADLTGILDHLHAESGPNVDADYTRNFDRLFDRLGDFPGLGTPKPHYGPMVRMSLVYPCFLFYRVSADRTFFLRILDGRRRITRKLVIEGRD